VLPKIAQAHFVYYWIIRLLQLCEFEEITSQNAPTPNIWRERR